MTHNPYKKISQEDLDYFKLSIGKENVSIEASDLQNHSSDETEDLSHLPDVILYPESSRHVSSIMAYCHENNIAVTPRGAGTGLSGGSIPILGGVSLSVKKMNKIVEIDTDNFQVVSEPGVITEVLQNAVKEVGLFYPPDPASKGSCFIGGNVAENSGGPKAFKYGVVSDYVLNLEAVLPNGEIIQTGANVLKNATGYNLTQLLVGSEGTLGVITQIVLKLIPHPKMDKLLLIPFHNAIEASKAVAQIATSGISPSALEFIDRDAISLALKYADEKPFALTDETEAHLIVEIDGNDSGEIDRDIEAVYEIAQSFAIGDILFAETAAEKEKLWKIRRSVGEAVKRQSIYKEEDTVVPRFHLPELLEYVKKLGVEYGFRSACYGHAGDGNLHVNIMKEDMTENQWNKEIPKAIRKLFTKVKSLGGTISGEHGIGLVQKPYLDIVFSKTEIELMKAIKNVFDPKGILNPGKIFPD